MIIVGIILSVFGIGFFSALGSGAAFCSASVSDFCSDFLAGMLDELSFCCGAGLVPAPFCSPLGDRCGQPHHPGANSPCRAGIPVQGR